MQCDAPVMRVDGGINQVASQSLEPRQRAILIRAPQAGCSRQNRRPGSPRSSVFPPWRRDAHRWLNELLFDPTQTIESPPAVGRDEPKAITIFSCRLWHLVPKLIMSSKVLGR